MENTTARAQIKELSDSFLAFEALIDSRKAVDWADSDAMVILDDGAAAMLSAPVEMTDHLRLESAATRVAWMRWCACKQGVWDDTMMPRLFAETESRLIKAGFTDLYCAILENWWPHKHLLRAGFSQVDEIIAMQRIPVKRKAAPAGGGVTMRNAAPADLNAIALVDCAAFEPAWRYSRFALGDGFGRKHIFRVAETTEIVGYALADRHFMNHAHLTRIAVHPSCQGRGIGGLLLADGMSEAKELGANTYTLSVQKTNTAAQKFYAAHGFLTQDSVQKILRKSLAS